MQNNKPIIGQESYITFCNISRILRILDHFTAPFPLFFFSQYLHVPQIKSKRQDKNQQQRTESQRQGKNQDTNENGGQTQEQVRCPGGQTNSSLKEQLAG